MYKKTIRCNIWYYGESNPNPNAVLYSYINNPKDPPRVVVISNKFLVKLLMKYRWLRYVFCKFIRYRE
jgi:hypothetical protein